METKERGYFQPAGVLREGTQMNIEYIELISEIEKFQKSGLKHFVFERVRKDMTVFPYGALKKNDYTLKISAYTPELAHTLDTEKLYTPEYQKGPEKVTVYTESIICISLAALTKTAKANQENCRYFVVYITTKGKKTGLAVKLQRYRPA